jgi:hypothetical protein
MTNLITLFLSLSIFCLISYIIILKTTSTQENFNDIKIPSSFLNSISGGNTSYYPTILTTKDVEPDEESILTNYRSCISSNKDTVKGCLTSSGAGFRPAICMSLCAEQYGDMSKECSRICTNQQTQVNTSARFGPA